MYFVITSTASKTILERERDVSHTPTERNHFLPIAKPYRRCDIIPAPPHPPL